MSFSTLELHFTSRVAALLICGFVATVANYWVVAKLKEVGIRTPMFGNVKGLLKTFETYRRLAPEKSWPTRPITAFCAAMLIGFIIVTSIYLVPLK